jgi:site-specific DNA-methyltransferase (adenine-specific)
VQASFGFDRGFFFRYDELWITLCLIVKDGCQGELEMQQNKIEQLYDLMDSAAEWILQDLQVSYLEALAEAGEIFLAGSIQQLPLSEDIAEKVNNLIKKYEESDAFEAEIIRKAFQLALLKNMKHYHPNRQMTPDTIGLFISYLFNKFVHEDKPVSIMDPAVGTGNLLFTVLNQLSGKAGKVYGADIDDILIKLAFIQADMQKKEITFFNQDSLQLVFAEQVDTIISDLPVGYYPNDEAAKNYELRANEGHSFSHYLYIEQSLRYTKPGGYLFFVIPNQLFTGTESKELLAFLAKEAHIYAILKLPSSIFKNESFGKSILVLRKKGNDQAAPSQILAADLPSFSDKNGMVRIMKQLEQWMKENLGKTGR